MGIRKADTVKVETMSPEPCAVRLSATDLRPGLEMQGVGLELEAGLVVAEGG